MEGLSLFLSMMAIIISIGVPIFEYFYNNRLNKINLISEYFKEVYGKYLMKEIPIARKYIHYNGQVLDGTDNIIEVLRKIREESVFFKYNDKSFYDKLIRCIQELEDLLILKTGIMSNDEYALFYSEYDKKLECVYECITDRHLGKKIKKGK